LTLAVVLVWIETDLAVDWTELLLIRPKLLLVLWDWIEAIIIGFRTSVKEIVLEIEF
jgi:hypothetical protein